MKKKLMCECGASLFEICLEGTTEQVVCVSCNDVVSETELCEDVIENSEALYL